MKIDIEVVGLQPSQRVVDFLAVSMGVIPCSNVRGSFRTPAAQERQQKKRKDIARVDTDLFISVPDRTDLDDGDQQGNQTRKKRIRGDVSGKKYFDRIVTPSMRPTSSYGCDLGILFLTSCSGTHLLTIRESGT